MSKKREERKLKKIESEKKQKHKKFSKVFFLDKKVSQTPLELLGDFKQTKTFFCWKKKSEKICKKRFGNKQGCGDIPLAYAGRLDPMASGKMLILAGEACKDRDKYLSLDKEYVFEILLGFGSDTKDILGLVEKDRDFYTNTSANNEKKHFLKKFIFNKKEDYQKRKLINKKIKKVLKELVGKREMLYPVFSSKAVKGKPLFLWALEKRLDEIEIPKKNIEIYNIKLEKIFFLKKEDMKKDIFKKIKDLKKVEQNSKKLGEDFRRIEVLESWEKSLRDFSPEQRFTILKIKTKVSSGTYMRNLAQDIGESLQTTGLAYSIKRTRFF